jgi:ABC-type Fe3+ transport system substrate-binding protein
MNKHESILIRQKIFLLERFFKREFPLPSRARVRGCWLAALFLFTVAGSAVLRAAETVDQLTSGAKKEGDEIVFVAGAQTFGGKKGLTELEASFNKKFRLTARVHFAAGPQMSSMAARLITEAKAGRKSSADFFLGSQSHFALLHQEKILETVNWSGIFPWLTKEMEISPGEGVLVYTALNGIIYNSNSIAKDKAPKRYEDLVDPALAPTWTRKLAIPSSIAWLGELSLIWGEEKVKDFARKLVVLSGGRLRYGEGERVVSGEFPIMANIGTAVEAMWNWQGKGAPLLAVPGSTPILTDYFQLGVPKNSAHPNLAKLFVAFMASKEAQAVLEKYEARSSHLVEGTRMAKYLQENRIKVLDAKQQNDFYIHGEASGLKLKEELAKIMKQ